MLTKKLQSDGYTISQTRKIVESVCMITEAVCLLLIGKIFAHNNLCTGRNIGSKNVITITSIDAI